jgi:AGZA family xanthine/uracil permease-like MFS transporter
MAYILVANPSILSAAGVPADAAVAATALTAGLASILMGLGANVPIALAPGMGLNAVIAFQAAPAAGSWQAAMGLVVLDGAVVLLLVLLGIREAVLRAIPVDLRRAIGAGIGVFIVFLGLVQAQLVVVPSSTVAALSAHPGLTLPPVTAGDWSAPGPLIAIIGFVAGACLLALGRAGAMLGAIAVSALLAMQTGDMAWNGAVAAWPRFDTLSRPTCAPRSTGGSFRCCSRWCWSIFSTRSAPSPRSATPPAWPDPTACCRACGRCWPSTRRRR